MLRDHQPGGEQALAAHRQGLTRRALIAAGLALIATSAQPRRTLASPLGAPRSPDGLLRLPGVSGVPGMGPVLTTSPMIEAAPPGALAVPYRSQLDGSPQAKANCGPASLGMLLAHLGNGTSIADLRWSINTRMGRWYNSNGSSWDALAHAAESRGLRAVGLYSAPRVLRRWTVDDLRAEIGQGYPAMILTRYKYLPGREGSWVQYNHYVVVVGLSPDGAILYHDPAYLDESTGAYLSMTLEQLDVAWSRVSTGANYSGMALRPPG